MPPLRFRTISSPLHGRNVPIVDLGIHTVAPRSPFTCTRSAHHRTPTPTRDPGRAPLRRSALPFHGHAPEFRSRFADVTDRKPTAENC